MASMRKGMRSANVSFNVKCEAVGYDQWRHETLSEPGQSEGFSICPLSHMDFAPFQHLKQWTFECAVIVTAMKTNDGQQIAVGKEGVAKMLKQKLFRPQRPTFADLEDRQIVPRHFMEINASMGVLRKRNEELDECNQRLTSEMEIANAKISSFEDMVKEMRSEMRSMRHEIDQLKGAMQQTDE